jgi:hypothetical protein
MRVITLIHKGVLNLRFTKDVAELDIYWKKYSINKNKNSFSLFQLQQQEFHVVVVIFKSFRFKRRLEEKSKMISCDQVLQKIDVHALKSDFSNKT